MVTLFFFHNESSYENNFIPNIVPPTSRNSVIVYSDITGHYLISTVPCVDNFFSLNSLPIQIPNG